MKKLLVTALAACTIIGSFATTSLAYKKILDAGFQNRYNGSYPYDIGWARVYVSENDYAQVRVRLKKDGEWRARKDTVVRGYSSGATWTCYSNTITGKGATGVDALIL